MRAWSRSHVWEDAADEIDTVGPAGCGEGDTGTNSRPDLRHPPAFDRRHVARRIAAKTSGARPGHRRSGRPCIGRDRVGIISTAWTSRIAYPDGFLRRCRPMRHAHARPQGLHLDAVIETARFWWNGSSTGPGGARNRRQRVSAQAPGAMKNRPHRRKILHGTRAAQICRWNAAHRRGYCRDPAGLAIVAILDEGAS